MIHVKQLSVLLVFLYRPQAKDTNKMATCPYSLPTSVLVFLLIRLQLSTYNQF